MQTFIVSTQSDVNLNRLVQAIQRTCLEKEPTKEEGDRFSLISTGNPENKTMMYQERNLGSIHLEVNERLVSRWIFTPNR